MEKNSLTLYVLQRLDKDETIVSFDVVSLFTSVPVEFAIDIVKRRLADTDKWKNYTSLTAKVIVDLLTFMLKNSFFKCGENFYHQISGCAMGSPVSSVIAELVMQEVETMALATSPVRVKWWKRYVDDSNSCMKNDYVNSFHNHLNSINQHQIHD